MQNLLRSCSLVLLLSTLVVEFEEIFAQCNPPPSETCEEASIFCSLDQMNGFSCNTPSQTQSTCRPGCVTGGFSLHRTWWAFVCQGGNISITLNVGSCIINGNGYGLVWGIFGDCQCLDEIKCVPWSVVTNQSETYQLNLKPCKIYYMFFDSGDDNCDFTLSTSGGGPPNLFLGHINNVSKDIIEPVCQGYCGYHFFVDQGGCLEANYEWTLDGNKVGDNKSDLKLDFPDAGDFKLCVTATLGNPNNGNICAMQGPTCTTVKVRAIPDKVGPPRTICYESANPNGYKWKSQLIYTSGTYREHYKDNNCCPFDSVVLFNVLPEPSPPEVYYITCDNTPYKDILGQSWSPCRDHWIINLPRTDGALKCDSSIRLTAINVDLAPQWEAKCSNGKVELSPNINLLKKCDVGESYDFEYKWYRKNDTMKKTIGSDEYLLVDTINDVYCIEVTVKVQLGNISSTCIKTFCDTINEAKAKGTTESKSVYYCDSITINNQLYTQSTKFTQKLKNVFGCDSIIITDLNITKSTASSLSLQGCDSLVINNQVYYQSGNYAQNFINSDNCDSLLLLNLTIGKTSKFDLKMTACDSLEISGKVYYQSGVYSEYYQSIDNCDSIVNLNLTIFKSQIDSLSFSDCDTVVYKGKIYAQSGDYPEYYTSVNGCDSIVNIHINITSSDTSLLILSLCDSITINGNFYDLTGIYTQKLVNSQNCDSLLMLDLKISKSSMRDSVSSGCDSLILGGKVYYQSGVYPEYYQSKDNCDSIVNLDLTIYKSKQDSLSFSDCDTVVFNGKIFTQTGVYPEYYTSANGCDSIVNIHINITKSNTSPYVLSKCDSATINGVYYDQTGIYKQTLISTNGCDSTLNINLTIGHKTFSSYNYTHCDSAILNGQWFYLTGNYTQIIKNTFQCDSTIELNLTINKSTSGDTIFRSCDSVTLNGITYRKTGIYQQMFTNSNQCDSVLTINFTRLSISSTNLQYKSCDSIELNNIVYKQSGLYSQKLSNVNQCDSLLSLDITINKSTSKDSTAQGCDSLVFNGQTYYQSGDYNQKLTNANLCDSSLNLSLTIYKSSTSINVLRACDSVYKFGKWFYQSGNYPQYLKDVHQCDSTVNFHLTINNGGKQTIYKTACDSLEFSGIWFNKSGQYNFYLLNTNGCDSTLTLDLTIKPGNPSTLDAGKDTSICEGDILKLNGVFSGNANFNWQSSSGNFDNPNNLVTNFYSKVIGDERIYLQASDDCKQWLDSLNVHIFPRQVVQVTGDTLVNPCKEIKFTASGGTNYIWTPSSFIECLDPPCSRVLLKSSSVIRFTISTDGPCAIPASLNLSLSQVQTDVYLPNAFSPNGDNINDVFLPVFNCEQVNYFNLQIFDRWGNLLFESLNKDKGWNGKSKDQLMNPGVYPYVLQYQVHSGKRKVKAGDVTLVR